MTNAYNGCCTHGTEMTYGDEPLVIFSGQAVPTPRTRMLHQRTFEQESSSTAFPVRAVDSQGNFYTLTPPLTSFLTYTAIKRSSAGSLAWTYTFNLESNPGSDVINSAIDVDREFNVYLAQYQTNVFLGVTTNSNSKLIKLNPNGSVAWELNPSDNAETGTGTFDDPNVVVIYSGVAVDLEGNVVACGTRQGSGVTTVGVVDYYNQDGQLIWRVDFEHLIDTVIPIAWTRSRAENVRFTKSGDVVLIASKQTSGTSVISYLVRIGSDGVVQYEREIGNITSGFQIDGNGNFYVLTQDGFANTNPNYVLSRLNPPSHLEEEWSVLYENPHPAPQLSCGLTGLFTHFPRTNNRTHEKRSYQTGELLNFGDFGSATSGTSFVHALPGLHPCFL